MKGFCVLTALLALGASRSHATDEQNLSETQGATRELTAFFSTSNDINNLLAAVQSNGITQVASILSCRCIDVNTPILLLNGRTVLFAAISTSSLAIVRLLLQAGADPNFRDSFGVTPVHLAAFNTNPAILRELIESGGDPKAKTLALETPLHLPGNKDTTENVRILLDAGADLEARDIQGETPLLEAVAYGGERVARLLLERGANINAKTANGTKPIDFICACLTYTGTTLDPCTPGQCTSQDIKALRVVLNEFLDESETSPKSRSKKRSKKTRKKKKSMSSSKKTPPSPLEKLKQKLDKLDKDRAQDG